MRVARLVAALAVVAAGTACSDPTRHAEIIRATARPDGAVSLSVGACNAESNTADVEEGATRVVITVTTDAVGRDDCADAVDVRLNEPLGARALVDGASGETLACDVQPGATIRCRRRGVEP